MSDTNCTAPKTTTGASGSKTAPIFLVRLEAVVREDRVQTMITLHRSEKKCTSNRPDNGMVNPNLKMRSNYCVCPTLAPGAGEGHPGSHLGEPLYLA